MLYVISTSNGSGHESWRQVKRHAHPGRDPLGQGLQKENDEQSSIDQLPGLLSQCRSCHERAKSDEKPG